MIFQDLQLADGATALTNVLGGSLGRHSFLSTLWGFPSEEQKKAHILLNQFGLSEKANQWTSTLSRGERQRVAACRTLLTRPLLLLADEPVSSLDPNLADQVLTNLKDSITSENGCVVCLHNDEQVANSQTLFSALIHLIRMVEIGKPQTEGQYETHGTVVSISLETFLLFLLGALGSFPNIEGSGRDLDYLGNLGRFASQFFPPDWSILDRTLEGLLETVQIALVSTLLAIIISIVLSVGAARTITPLWLLWPTRMVLNVIRTTWPFWHYWQWSLLGPILAGVIALTFYSVGYLASFSARLSKPLYRCSKALHWEQALYRHSNMGYGPMPCPSYGAIAYGCSSTMYARPALLDMLEPVVSDYLNFMRSLRRGNKFSSPSLHPCHCHRPDFTGEKIRKSIRDKLRQKFPVVKDNYLFSVRFSFYKFLFHHTTFVIQNFHGSGVRKDSIRSTVRMPHLFTS